MQRKNNLATIIQSALPFYKKTKKLAPFQLKALDAIMKCRTPELGGSMLACKECGEIHYVMHSCRNRHCPRCQGIDKELWIEARKQELLPVKYYHVVFTVPHDLLELFRFNRETMYNLLFEKAWETLQCFGQNQRMLGANIGAIAILHTWDQQLNFHPHLHFIVPAGGINNDDKWINSKANGEFLFDVKEMSKVFSARFAKKLRKLKKKGSITKFVPKDLIKKPWVVYAKKAFGSPETVVEYLGRYTHRVAIAEHRLKNIEDGNVTFQWLDRKNGYSKKETTISQVEFLERFVEHIVPPYFRRIRHLGILSNRTKKQNLKLIRNQLEETATEVQLVSRAEILKQLWGEQSLLHCRSCGGELVLIETYSPTKRAPPNVA